MEQLTELQNMFPGLDSEVVALVVSRHQSNVELAVEKLLELASQAETQQPGPSGATRSSRRPAQHRREPRRQSKRLVLIRGLPGSGKTTLARSLKGQYGVICCTDDFFISNGRYEYNASLVPANHEKNQEKAKKCLFAGRSPVIIDNTNTSAWEMKPYVIMAVEYGYDVEIVEPDTPWRFRPAELARRNQHGVTRARIESMLARYEHKMSVERIMMSQHPNEARKANKQGKSPKPVKKLATEQSSGSCEGPGKSCDQVLSVRDVEAELLADPSNGSADSHVSSPRDNSVSDKQRDSTDATGERGVIEVRTLGQEVRRPRPHRELALLTEAFDSCTGWHESYMREAIQDERKDKQFSFLPENFDLTFGSPLSTGSVRQSRLIRGLSLKQEPPGDTEERLLSELRNNLMSSPFLSDPTIENSTDNTDKTTDDTNSNTIDRTIDSTCTNSSSDNAGSGSDDEACVSEEDGFYSSEDEVVELSDSGSHGGSHSSNNTGSHDSAPGSCDPAPESCDSERSDLLFLVECFPELDRATLRELLDSQHTVQDAVSAALVAMTTPVTVATGEDERLARLLQEELDSKSPEGNLELSLTPSLARQLAALYGPVDHLLSQPGEVKPYELQVLLSDSVAQGLYRIWVETLKARRVEMQFSAQLLEPSRAASEPLPPAAGPAHRKHHHSSPAAGCLATGGLADIMSAQLAQELGHQELAGSVEGALTVAQRLQLSQLCSRFPEAPRSKVTALLVESQFDYDATAGRLSSLYPEAVSDRKSTPPTQEVSYQRLEGEPGYDELRAEASLHAKLRAEAFQKAAGAHAKKQYELASFYAQQGHLHSDRMKEANRRAAQVTVGGQVAGRLDLHGLHVTEAIEALKYKLAATKPGKSLVVVTGRGAHSAGQQARIKPAVLNYLSSANYKYELLNAGLLRVTL